MHRFEHQKSSLFLLELILNFLFFMFVAAICLQMYLKSHQISSTSTALSQSVTICNSIASICQSSTAWQTTLTEAYPNARLLDKEITVYLDADYQDCSPDASPAYVVEVTFSDTEPQSAQIDCYKQGRDTPVYSVSASVFHPKTLDEITGGAKQ